MSVASPPIFFAETHFMFRLVSFTRGALGANMVSFVPAVRTARATECGADGGVQED